MLKTSLFTLLFLGSLAVNAQTDKNLEKFYAMLTPTNLDSAKNTSVKRTGSVITIKDFSYNRKEYTFVKADITKMTEIRWTQKEEYDYLYPEDSLINADAEHITIFLEKGIVERDTYWTSNDQKEYIGEYGETNIASTCKGCDFITFNFINSELAGEAKGYLEAYRKEKKK